MPPLANSNGGFYMEGEIDDAVIISVPCNITESSVGQLRGALEALFPDRKCHVVTQNIEFVSVEKVPTEEAVQYLAAWDRWRAAEKDNAARARTSDTEPKITDGPGGDSGAGG